MFDANIFPDRSEPTMDQPTLYEQNEDVVEPETVLLYALGEFQSRGHALAGRELALDRLHGAFHRAAKKFNIGELSDEIIVKELKALGSDVTELPGFMAKRPFRVKISKELSARAETFFTEAASKG